MIDDRSLQFLNPVCPQRIGPDSGDALFIYIIIFYMLVEKSIYTRYFIGFKANRCNESDKYLILTYRMIVHHRFSINMKN